MGGKIRHWLTRHKLTPVGGALVVLAVVGVILLVGDVPRREKELPDDSLIQTTWGVKTHRGRDPRLPRDWGQGLPSLALQVEQAELRADLPALPWGSAKIHGSLFLEAVAVEPADVRLWVMLPPNSQLKPAPLDKARSYRRTWRLLSREELASRGYVHPDEPTPTAAELRLEIDQPCAQVDEGFQIVVSDPRFSHGDGWGRQQIRMGYYPLGRWADDADVRRSALRVCKTNPAEFDLGPGHLAFHPGDRQRVVEFSPGPSEPSPYGLVWNLPTDGKWAVGQVKVENAPVRFAIEQGIQVLYLVLGALLGGLAVRISGRDGGHAGTKTSTEAGEGRPAT